MSKKRSFTALVVIAVSASLSLAIVVPTRGERAAAPLTGQQLAAASRINSDLVNDHLLAPPTATVALRPSEAYPDSTLRGSATFGDSDGDLEGASTYRWLVNGNQIAAGEVAQSLLLPLDGSLLTTDGQTPTQNDGLTFVAGRFGQAVQTSEDDDSRLSYVAANNVDPN
jgi:hypothetical protein